MAPADGLREMHDACSVNGGELFFFDDLVFVQFEMFTQRAESRF